MVHKIQTAPNTWVSLEVKDRKSERCLVISKGASILVFNHQQTSQLNAIVQAIDSGNFALKEYGVVKK